MSSIESHSCQLASLHFDLSTLRDDFLDLRDAVKELCRVVKEFLDGQGVRPSHPAAAAPSPPLVLRAEEDRLFAEAAAAFRFVEAEEALEAASATTKAFKEAAAATDAPSVPSSDAPMTD